MRRVPIGEKTLDGAAFWVFPFGHCLQISARSLATSTPEDLQDMIANRGAFSRTYEVAEKKFGYVVLGDPSNDEFEAYINQPAPLMKDLMPLLQKRVFDATLPDYDDEECWFLK